MDEKLLKKIIAELSKYDYCDLMIKISILTTMCKNQDVNSLFACLINALIDINNTNNKPKIPLVRFKTIIKELESLSITSFIDPVENLFFDIVSLDKQYFSYENINTNPSFILNHMIMALKVMSSNNKYNEFCTTAFNTIIFILQFQNNIILKSRETNIENRNYEKQIYFYDSNYFNKLKNEMYIDYDKALAATNGEIDKLIINDFGSDKNLFGYMNGIYTFFYKPFLKFENKLLILDPTFLTTACTNYIIMLSKKYNIISDLIKEYKNSVISTAIFSIKKIDNVKYVEYMASNTKNIDFAVEKISDKRIILHVFVTDDEDSYEENSYTCSDFAGHLIDENVMITINALKKQYDEIKLNLSAITYGRGISLGTNIKLPCMSFTPYQLEIISKNKRLSNNILYYYIKDKDSRTNEMGELALFSNSFGDFRDFIVYDEHECSLYIDDSIEYKKTNIFIDFDVIYEYVYRAFSLKDNKVLAYNNSYLRIDHIENNKYFGIIENKPMFVIKGKDSFFIALGTFDKTNNQTYVLTDYLSYWFSESIDYLKLKKNYLINVTFLDSGCLNVANVYADEYSISFSANEIEKLSCDNHDNTNEKMIFLSILEKIGIEISNDHIEQVFNNKLKKKIYSFESQSLDFMIPCNDFKYPIPIASKSEMSLLLDAIGDYFITSKYNVGDIIQGADRGKLCNDIVEYVYNLFVKMISDFDYKTVIDLAYTMLEKTIPEIVIRNDNYKNMINLYPDKIEESRKIINEYNISSVGLRFILEYVGAIQNKGTKKCDYIDLEQLMAYVCTIIDWATASDLFTYEMIDDNIEVLPSKRFGYDKKNTEYVNHLLSNTQFDFLSSTVSKENYKVSFDEKNDLFNKDYGYTFHQYVSILGLLHEYGEEQSSELKEISYEQWSSLCKNRNVPCQLVGIINDISIEKREDYFSYKHYAKRELYPWRFNRVLSLFRRPLIKIDDNYYWGNRNLNHNVYYISNLIDNGIFNSGKKKNNYSIKFNGNIAVKRGEQFNDIIYDVFNNFRGMKTFKNIISINSNHISDEYGNDLGDIDVFAISTDMNKIFVVEVKDYSIARNINDLSLEIKKIFHESNGEKSDYDKHIARYKWVCNHISDVIKEFDLRITNWKIIPLFVTDQPMVSRKLENEDINMIDYSKLNYEFLKRIK